MDLYPLILVMIASVLHLGWNTITKQATDKLVILWIALAVPGVVGSLICLFLYDLSSIPMTALLCILASAFIHALYFWGLSKAYTSNDLSFVYPYTRGLGALFAAAGGAIFLKEIPSILGGIGVGTIIMAILLEPLLTAKKTNPEHHISFKDFLFVFITAVMIGTYFVIDTIGVRLMPVSPYLLWMLTLSALFLTPAILVHKDRIGVLKSNLKHGVYGALFLYSAYALALMAIQIAPVAYVASARALGIIISGLIGYFFLKEALSKYRLLSIAMICFGIFLIGIA